MDKKNLKNKRTIIKLKDNLDVIKIESKKYIIYLKKNKIHNSITISVSPHNKDNKDDEITHKTKITDFSTIDYYFIKFKGNAPLLLKYLERIFISNLFSININNNNKESLTITLFCLFENNNKFIDIVLPKANVKKKKNQVNVVHINDRGNHDSINKSNLGCAPPSNACKNIITPNFFYYKTKIKNLEYYIYLSKNEYKDKNYEEIYIQIFENEKDSNIGYYIYLNLVDFFSLSESYYSLFDYSIDDIYDDLIIILSNWNYRIEKHKENLKLVIKVYSMNLKINYYKDIYFLLSPINRTDTEMNIKINSYFYDIRKYVNKFGDNINDKKIHKLIYNPNKKKLNSLNINKEKEKEKDKDKEKNENNDNNQIIDNERLCKRIKRKKLINDENNNFNNHNNKIIINKETLTLKIDENKNINNSINNNTEIYRNNINNNIIINNNINNNIDNFRNNINNNICINNNNISLNENDEEKKIKIYHNQNKDNKNKEKKNLCNTEIIPSPTENHGINIENKKLLNQKRSLKKLYNNIFNDKYLLVNSLNQILDKRKIICEINNLLNHNQLSLIVDKIEKNIPEFRFLNLIIHSKIVYEINANEITNDNCQKIINEFYEKSKNIKNLIFLIRTIKHNIFGGFTQIGFNLDDKKIYNIYPDSNSFVFSADKMKIYDLCDKNNCCIFCNNFGLPEFNNQIFFGKNNVKIGYTGKKKMGYLVDEDYELNNGEEKFTIDKIQLINIYAI